MTDVSKHTFNQGVDTILKECLAISDQRGAEYEDSWNLKNVSTPAMSHVLRLKGTFDGDDEMLDKRWRRLLLMASLIDVKLSRMLGPHKDDTFIDLINYSACFAYLMREWTQTIKNRPNGQTTPANIPTFNGDINGDLRPIDYPYAAHYHNVKMDIIYPTNNAENLQALHHMQGEHRQDSSPVLLHQALHQVQEFSQSFLDSEYGPQF